jgi:hypothetical protein
VQLCPRALRVLKRQLALRERLAAAGKIHHDHVFVHASGEPLRDLQVATIRWRKTLLSLKVRYCRPYTARHSSVSWNLMLGKNVLWVAKQHGHSIMTMLRTYASWTEGAVEADVQAIERSMVLTRTRALRERPRKPPRGGGRLSTDAGAASTLEDLAVDQSVVITIKGPRDMPCAASDVRVRPPTACSAIKNRLRESWLGWQDSNLRMAGSKDTYPHNQQVADLSDSLAPSTPFDSPSLPLKLPLGSARSVVPARMAARITRYPFAPRPQTQLGFGNRRRRRGRGTPAPVGHFPRQRKLCTSPACVQSQLSQLSRHYCA